jgi:hypothetical protein
MIDHDVVEVGDVYKNSHYTITVTEVGDKSKEHKNIKYDWVYNTDENKIRTASDNDYWFLKGEGYGKKIKSGRPSIKYDLPDSLFEID